MLSAMRSLSTLAFFLCSAACVSVACSSQNDKFSGFGSDGGPNSSGGGSGSGAGSGSSGGSLIGPNGEGGTTTCALTCSPDLHDVVDCHGTVVTPCPVDQGCGPGGACVPACSAAQANK